jgi:hypothetical protein
MSLHNQVRGLSLPSQQQPSQLTSKVVADNTSNTIRNYGSSSNVS